MIVPVFHFSFMNNIIIYINKMYTKKTHDKFQQLNCISTTNHCSATETVIFLSRLNLFKNIVQKHIFPQLCECSAKLQFLLIRKTNLNHWLDYPRKKRGLGSKKFWQHARHFHRNHFKYMWLLAFNIFILYIC